MRYSQMLTIIKELKPKRILEIGTHNGTRPVEWYKAYPHFDYIGIDLFEMGNDETLAKEGLRYKSGSNILKTKRRLADLGLSHQLFKGYSKDMLQKFKNQYGRCIDFAFIDGGHYVPTIKQDWLIVKDLMNKGGVVIFDDYYSNCPGIDISTLGCNDVIKNIPGVKLLPHIDNVVGRLGQASIQLVQVNF